MEEQRKAVENKQRQIEEKERALAELDKQLKKRKEQMDQLEISLQKVSTVILCCFVLIWKILGRRKCSCSWRTKQEISRSRKELRKSSGRSKTISCRNGKIITISTNESRRTKYERKTDYGFTTVGFLKIL